jgi:MscS family membrane protein
VKQDVLLKIVEIVHEHGADFAFPTTTLDGLGQLRTEPEALKPN